MVPDFIVAGLPTVLVAPGRTAPRWPSPARRLLATGQHGKGEKSTLAKAQEKKTGTDSSRGAIRKNVKALLSPIDTSPERTSDKSIRRHERRSRRDPNYARNRLISTLANTDPEDLFSSGAPGDLLDLQSEAGPPVSPTPLIRRTRSSRKPRQRPKMSRGERCC